MADFPVIAMNKGKATPLVDARSDVEAYSGLCRELQNMLPRIYGPVERRPGTKYIADCEDHNVKSRMVPFVFSSTIAYDIEFSALKMNIYFDGSIVDENIVSPYTEADLFQLQFNQSADVMWIVHPDYAPRKLSRTSPTVFSLDKISFTNGPFIKRNDLANNDGVTMAVTGYSVDTATSGPPGSGEFTITSDTDISSQFPTNHRFYVTGLVSNDGAYTVLSSSYAAGTLTVVPNELVASSANSGQIMVDDASVTLTASSATFEAGHVDALFKLTHKRAQVVTKGTATEPGVVGDAIDVKGSWTFTTSGNWGMTVEIQRLADGTNWETFRSYVSTIADGVGSRNVQKSDIEEENGVQYRINVIEVDGEPGSLTADFVVDKSTQDSIFKITEFNSTVEVTATALVAAPENGTTTRWAEGSWSDVRGWPTSVTFFEERSVYGFTNEDAQIIWISGPKDFEDFDAGTNDNDSFALRVPTANRGRWVSSLEALAVGMSGDEWRIQSSALDQPLTPTDFSIKRQTKFGSTNIQAVAVNEAIIFIDSVARKIREFTFSDPKQKFVSPDLTALAEDITKGGITSVGVQNNPDNIVWFTIASSPYLISMTYEREQNVVAFAQHPVGGNGEVESISITPSPTEDVITLSVKRTINGSPVRYIEQMQPREWTGTDYFFVDAGIIDTSGTTTITGLGHLEGETVIVLVDGALQTSKVVSSGKIIIDEAGARAVVGLPFDYRVSPMRLDANGSTYGSIKKISEVVVSFFETLNAIYGDGTTQYDINWRTEEDYDSPPDLFTGDKTLTFDGGFTTEDELTISGSDPFPCVVRALIPRIEKTGR
jgi:hypothetical protein